MQNRGGDGDSTTDMMQKANRKHQSAENDSTNSVNPLLVSKFQTI